MPNPTGDVVIVCSCVADTKFVADAVIVGPPVVVNPYQKVAVL